MEHRSVLLRFIYPRTQRLVGRKQKISISQQISLRKTSPKVIALCGLPVLSAQADRKLTLSRTKDTIRLVFFRIHRLSTDHIRRLTKMVWVCYNACVGQLRRTDVPREGTILSTSERSP